MYKERYYAHKLTVIKKKKYMYGEKPRKKNSNIVNF